MRIIKYNLCTKINHGTEEAPNWEEILYAKEIRCAEDALEANEAIAAKEAHNGEYTVEDDGMRPETKARIIAFNKAAAERKEKASDMDILIRAIGKLPLGPLGKVLSKEVIAVLQKYQIDIE